MIPQISLGRWSLMVLTWMTSTSLITSFKTFNKSKICLIIGVKVSIQKQIKSTEWKFQNSFSPQKVILQSFNHSRLRTLKSTEKVQIPISFIWLIFWVVSAVWIKLAYQYNELKTKYEQDHLRLLTKWFGEVESHLYWSSHKQQRTPYAWQEKHSSPLLGHCL